MFGNTNPGLFRGLQIFKNIKFGAILDGTSKTLNVINQAIPVYYQVKPLVSNIKTLSKINNIISTGDANEDKYTNKNNNSSMFYIK